jgi:hypothetical protein
VARPLTRAEATVIGSLLAGTGSTDRERIQASGLPARTFEVARLRVIAAGWVVDRYVPDPTLAGRSRAVFALGRPFAERRAEQAGAWAAAPSNVLLWESPQSLFGVFFVAAGSAGDAELGRLFPAEAYSRVAVVDADLKRPTVPVYFDFEGAWRRVLGLPGTLSYPRSIPHGQIASRSPGRPPAPEVQSLVDVPFLPHDAEHPGLEIARRFGRVDRYRRRLEPYVERRYFLDPATLPGYNEWTLGAVVFISGRLKAGATPEPAFHRLVSRCDVAPFLFVTDGRSVLVGTLSPGPPPSAARPAPPRASVTGTLQQSLEGIELFREPVPGLVCVTNHRYDRLFEPATHEVPAD